MRPLRFLTLLIAGAALALTNTAGAQQQKKSMAETRAEMSRAVISTYTDMIKEDPSDYMSYFSRGSEYYNLNEYMKALDDINLAMRYAPADEKDLRFQCLVTRSNIYEQLHRYNDAVNDLNSALSLDPQCISCIYQLANIEYELGHYSTAGQNYQKVLRLIPRNREALFGLARVAVKENNMGMAAKYCDDAVNLAPNDSESKLQRATVRSMMQNHEGAVDDLIEVIAAGDRNASRALRSLISLGNTNYPAVINGLSRAINASPRSGIYYYLRAVIAQSHGNYLNAITDINTIIDNNLDSYPGLNLTLAECYYALGRYDAALSNIDYAIGANADEPTYYTMKARIRIAMKDYEGALFAAEKALDKNPEWNNALVEKALALTGLGRASEASVALAEALMNEADNAYLYMLRAWISGDILGEKKVAESLYGRVLDIPQDFDLVTSYRGFAQLFSGNAEAGERWMREVLDANTDHDGSLSYYAACFYAQAGNPERALSYMEASLRNGYANYHNWMDNNDARINVAPIRNLPKFQELINRYASIFGR